jgi:gentisate 1,2-dioxygenase
MYVYRWDETRSLLEKFRDHDGSKWDAISLEYRDPTTGRTAYPTMTFFGQLLRPGEKTLPQKQNASLVCIAFEGAGKTTVDGQIFEWKPFDAIAVPGGTWFHHENASDKDDAILFVTSDEPTLKALGFHRRQGRTEDGTIIRLD